MRLIHRPRPRDWPPFGPESRIWTFNAVLALIAAWAFVAWVSPVAPSSSPVAMPWWLLAGLVFLAEVFVIHVHFRGEAESFSLNEIPVVLGLFFVAPAGIVVAQLVGAAVALGLYRRQAPMKLAFNLALCALQASLAVAVFNGLSGGGASLEPSHWVAAFAATMLASIVGVVAVATVVSLVEGRPQPAQLKQIVGLGTIVPLTNTSLALVGVTIIWSDPRAIWLLAVPVATLLLAYRAYIRERQKHERLEWLYEASRILEGSTDLEAVMLALLEHLRRMFRADVAEIVILPRNESAEALAMTVGPGESVEPMHPIAEDHRAELRARLASDGRSLLLPRSRGQGQESSAEAFGLVDLIAAPLHGDSHVSGAILVANRRGAVSTFDTDDLDLLEAVSRQAAVALENGRLEASLARVSELRDQLRYQAYHDPLTNLANRRMLVEDLERRLDVAKEGDRVPAVLFVDLDDFKLVNDTLGHAAGDEVLVAVAERIRKCLRTGDLPARLGGDEFAVLLDDAPDLGRALLIARRLVDTLQAPFSVEGRDVTMGASIGIASTNDRSERPDELLRNADVAMYTAKARGKAQFAVFEPAMQAAAVERHVMPADPPRAPANGEPILRYRPVVDL